MDIKFGFTSASKNVGNKDENGKRVQSKISNVVANIKAICAYCEKEFEYKPSYGGTHTYCSSACAAAAKRLHMSLILNVLHVVNLFILSQVE